MDKVRGNPGYKTIDKQSMDSLKSIATHNIASNLLIQIRYNENALKLLPLHLKEQILKLLLAPGKRYPQQKIKMEDILLIFVNLNTKFITLSSIDYMNDDILEYLTYYKNLSKIVFPAEFMNTNITEKGLIHFFEASKNLEDVTLVNEKHVTDEVVKCLAKCCDKIKILDLKGCINVTDGSILYLKDLQLCCLNLSKTSITNDGLFELTKGTCISTLKELKIDSCPMITWQGIQRFTPHCTVDYFSFNYINDVPMDEIQFKHQPKDISWFIS